MVCEKYRKSRMIRETLGYATRRTGSPLTEMRKIVQGPASQEQEQVWIPIIGLRVKEIIGDFDKRCFFWKNGEDGRLTGAPAYSYGMGL